MSRRNALTALVLVVVGAAVWAMLVALPRRVAPVDPGEATQGTAPAAAERRITATLYYISEDGMALVGLPREVAFGDAVVDQARRIVEAQLGVAPAPLASAIPDGTHLRALFISERGDAYVDLSGEARSNHRGGALDELFTVYAIVNALTVNLPSIGRVQILVDGEEVDTLAGHVDLRSPLRQGLSWVAETDKPEAPATPPGGEGGL